MNTGGQISEFEICFHPIEKRSLRRQCKAKGNFRTFPGNKIRSGTTDHAGRVPLGQPHGQTKIRKRFSGMVCQAETEFSVLNRKTGENAGELLQRRKILRLVPVVGSKLDFLRKRFRMRQLNGSMTTNFKKSGTDAPSSDGR